MLKEWYILLEGGKQEGPFTWMELRDHPFVTPDTLVWKQGMEGWKQIRYVAELKDTFKDRPESVPTEDLIKPKKTALPDKQEVLTLQRDPMQFMIWTLILIILILLYLYYQNGYFR